MSALANSTDPRNPRRSQTDVVGVPYGGPQETAHHGQQHQQQPGYGPPRGQSRPWSGDGPYVAGGPSYGPPAHQTSYQAAQSTPSLHHPSHPQSSPPPLPPSYNAADLSANLAADPTADLNFNAMRVSDPLPRSNTSMSSRSGPPQSSGYGRGGGGGAPSVYSLDMGSVNGGGGGSAEQYEPAPYQGGQRGSYSSQDGGWDQQGYQDPHQPRQPYDHQQQQYQPYHPQQQQPHPSMYQQPPVDYSNPYYAAASGVLGYPPNLGQQGPSRPYPPMPPIPQGAAAGPSNPSLNRAMSTASSMSGASLARSGTSIGSSNAKRKGSLATVDARKPPYTKAFVDEYRARMKGDPDPEAQFQFAKYLIEAAKKLGEEVSREDPKSGRKYRDLLLAESLKLIKKLATHPQEPFSDAQFFLADLYGTGQLGLQGDPEKAYNLYLQASKQNHPAATYRAAVCNELGAGTRKEPNRAVLFFRKAASLGDTTAMYKLGMILLEGKLQQPRNAREGVHWLRRAASQADETNPHALHELGMLHENPPTSSAQYIQLDQSLSKDLFTQAAQLGYAPSQLKLGTCYEYGNITCPVDPRRSIAWYTKAAEKGNAEAELALSGWYLTGSEGVLKQSDSESYLWARKAANKGLAKAEYAVGYYTEQGIGTNSDLETAKKWYMRAAAQENKRAMQRLTELKKLGAKSGKGARPTREQARKECVIS